MCSPKSESMTAQPMNRMSRARNIKMYIDSPWIQFDGMQGLDRRRSWSSNLVSSSTSLGDASTQVHLSAHAGWSLMSGWNCFRSENIVQRRPLLYSRPFTKSSNQSHFILGPNEWRSSDSGGAFGNDGCCGTSSVAGASEHSSGFEAFGETVDRMDGDCGTPLVMGGMVSGSGLWEEPQVSREGGKSAALKVKKKLSVRCLGIKIASGCESKMAINSKYSN